MEIKVTVPAITRAVEPTGPGEPTIIVDISQLREERAQKVLAEMMFQLKHAIPRPVYRNLANLTGLSARAVDQAIRDIRRCPDLKGAELPIGDDGTMLLSASQNPMAQRAWETKRAAFVESEGTTVRETDRRAALSLGYSPATLQISVPDPLAIAVLPTAESEAA